MTKQYPYFRFLNSVIRSLFLVFLSGASVIAAPCTERGIATIDSLPEVFNDDTDVLHAWLRLRASRASKLHQLPGNAEEWEKDRAKLREAVIQNAGVKFFPGLPLDMRETRSMKGDGFTVKNIFFQTRPDVYATANLFVPEGSGEFPGVVVMMGHSSNGKLYENYQLVGQSLAKEGYVALCMDPWGAGERTTQHGEFEYHGSVLGASLMNVGETLLGMQVTDNIRGVDLLQSLPYVDKEMIGATGASGGGNQTMWLAAVDERVKAAMPVVSVGTFDSYVGAHNCVCEVLPNGLTFTEEWGVLGLVAPRAIKMCNHNQESNPTFFPSEMLKSYKRAQPVFDYYGVKSNIQYELFERPHGYFPEDREALLGWMDLHLKGKGDGAPRKEKSLTLLPVEDLMVFKAGDRDPRVHSTESFTRMTGESLKKELESARLDADTKRAELAKVLSISLQVSFQEHELGEISGWERFVLERPDGKILPLLVKAGSGSSYAVFAHSDGKAHIPLDELRKAIQAGKGVVVVDFSGTGEAGSQKAAGFDKLGHLHTYGRASLWLGETVIGNWAGELSQVDRWLKSRKNAGPISFHGYKSAGLAGIFYAALGGKLSEIHTYGSPASYLADTRQGVEYFGVGVHIPGILKWGDVSLAAGLSNSKVFLHQPLTMSGRALNQSEKETAKKEFERMRAKVAGKGTVILD